ncbi:hypothetical protein PCH_Pc15g01980 [Penicillium rubens Wisconsin 54-1255]|uniref:Uncharacterized protein n=1 Tax=Penicillium rubens (strain ATCC 28089 / DSM 1075 / NRRL 1951 / Wisconsin 54-1255) TaxID=500485 RepID=B6H6D2_PENRW|nr:hypothetical protein PCH_Pc15g01980 [Penicillium rubens Wisconsin 54-1255]
MAIRGRYNITIAVMARVLQCSGRSLKLMGSAKKIKPEILKIGFCTSYSPVAIHQSSGRAQPSSEKETFVLNAYASWRMFEHKMKDRILAPREALCGGMGRKKTP